MQTGNKKTFRLVRRFRNIGKYRDSALVGAGLVYLVGYAVWFVIAWKQGLGPVPILDAQYFVAALPILLVVTMTVLVFRVLFWGLPRRLAKWLEKLSVERVAAMRRLANLPFLLWLFGFTALLLSAVRLAGHTSDLVRMIILLCASVFAVAAYVIVEFRRQCSLRLKAARPTAPSPHQDRTRVIGYLSYLPVLPSPYLLGYILVTFALGAVIIYVDFIYISIPPEFGGAKPRTAQLDLARDSFSAEMIQTLTDAPTSDPNEKAFLTKPIDVLFAGSEHLIIDPAPEDPNSRDRVEIAREAIKAILWHRAEQLGKKTTPQQAQPARPKDANGV